ncbi:MAG: nucleoside transporter C-terminal domain-containing protein [Bdellovibrionales bacterium]
MSLIQASLGIVIFPLIAWLLSENRTLISWRLVVSALLMQFVFGLTLLNIPFIREVLFLFNDLVLTLDRASKDGASFVFGYLGGGDTPFTTVDPSKTFIIAFQVLPIIIVVSALSSLLFHWGILQKVIGSFSLLLRKTLKIDGVTGMGVASSIFLGIIESPIFIKPYLKNLSRSGLFTLITAGMATVAGTVMVLYSSILSSVVPNAAAQILVASLMSAPAAIMMAQMIIPSEGDSTESPIPLNTPTRSAFEAIINGANEGVQMCISIAGVLIVLFAFISLINMGLGVLPSDEPITIQNLAGYVFVPFVWLMGIDSTELFNAGQLMGTKLMLNEFVAYTQMGQMLTIEKIKSS